MKILIIIENYDFTDLEYKKRLVDSLFDKYKSNFTFSSYIFYINSLNHGEKLIETFKNAIFSWDIIISIFDKGGFEYLLYIPFGFTGAYVCDFNNVFDIFYDLLNSNDMYDYYQIPSASYQDVNLELYNKKYLDLIKNGLNGEDVDRDKIKKMILNHENIILICLKHKEHFSKFYPSFLDTAQKTRDKSLSELVYATNEQTKVPLIFQDSIFSKARRILVSATGKMYFYKNLIELILNFYPKLQIDLICAGLLKEYFKDYIFLNSVISSSDKIISFDTLSNLDIKYLIKQEYDLLLIPTTWECGKGYKELYDIAKKTNIKKVIELSYNSIEIYKKNNSLEKIRSFIFKITPFTTSKKIINILNNFYLKKLDGNIKNKSCPYCKSNDCELFYSINVDYWFETMGLYHNNLKDLKFLYNVNDKAEMRRKRFNIINDIIRKNNIIMKLNYYQCKNCGIVYDNYPHNEESQNNFYSILYRIMYEDENKRYGRYENEKFVLRKEQVGRYLIDKLKDFINKGDKILDIGCAEGILVNFFIKNGYDAYGIDSSTQQILYAKEILGIKKVCSGNYINTDFGTNFFDLIVIHHVAEHINEQKNLFDKIDNDIKLNGFLLIQIPDLECISQSKEALNYVLFPGHIIAYDKKFITGILEQRGYKIFELRQIPFKDRNFQYLHFDISIGDTGDSPGSISILAQKIKK